MLVFEMINNELIMNRIAVIREDVNRLKLIQEMSLEGFKKDPDNYAIAEHHLRRTCEAVLDMGRHIIAKSSFRKATDYTEIIDILSENKVIPSEFAEEFRKMAGFRNRLVHVYWEVTPEELYQVIKDNLDNFVKFYEYILKYTKKVAGEK